MSNVLESDWIGLTGQQQRHAIRSLFQVVQLIFETDLDKFLPKVNIL
jgi:hypothetical protein